MPMRARRARRYRRAVSSWERRWDQVRRADPRFVDGALAVLFATVGLLSVFGQDIRDDQGALEEGFHEPGPLVVLTVLAVCLPIATRRRAPLASLVVAAVGIAVHVAVPWPEGTLPLAVLLLTYTVGAHCPPPRAIAGLAVVAVALAGLAIAGAPGLDAVGAIGVTAQFAAVWAIGVALRNRRAATDARVRAADEQAEAARQSAARALAEERLRIAQELHDVVAHSMSVIAVQAGAGAHVLDERPDDARRALEAINATARGTLTELRRLLGVLRDADGDRAVVPAPGLADLPRLVNDVRAVGVPAHLHVEGTASAAHAGVELSAYRVVQEALTNVIKARRVAHAGGCHRAPPRGRSGRRGGGRRARAGRPAGGDGRRRERAGPGGDARAGAAVGRRAGGGAGARRRLPGAGAAALRGAGVTIRVLVADDQALVRSGFTMLLSGEADLEVVGEAANGAEAVAAVAREHPDVVLMDIRMPVVDGLEATRMIAGDPALAATRVLILTTFDLDEHVLDALRAGASGFLLKDTLPVDLLRAVRVVAAGDALIEPRITRRLIEEFARRPGAGGGPVDGAAAVLDVLTEREREVLALVARGRSNAEIAAELIVSHATVKTHVSRLLMKLDARDRAQLVVVAYETGVVSPGVP